MATHIEIDITELNEFFQELDGITRTGRNGRTFREEVSTWMEAIGLDFLRVVQDEIIRLNVMDYRLLLSSFMKGESGNVWRVEEGGMVMEVGSSVEYAGYVNDGHWTNPRGVAKRFVPGHWEGYRFIYVPGEKTGMVLKQHWVEGKHYFDSALRIYDRMLPRLLEAKLSTWLRRFF